MSEANDSGSRNIPCDGWWEQEHYGRQPMRDLTLRFEAGKIRGLGMDIVGPFVLTGTISESGQVAMLKKYVGQHSVEYLGSYDGEGTMWGEWRIGPMHNRWLITMKGPTHGSGLQESQASTIG